MEEDQENSVDCTNNDSSESGASSEVKMSVENSENEDQGAGASKESSEVPETAESDVQTSTSSGPSSQPPVTTFKLPTLSSLPAKPLAAFEDKEKSVDSKSSTTNEATGNEKIAEGKVAKHKTGQKSKAKMSPAELLKQQQIPIPYKEPEWGGPCEQMYTFEILKKGVIIGDVDLTTKSFHVFGRLPSCDVTMEHPSLSRYHAVVQHCATANEKHEVGWYLYDLDSTHGTWVNKVQLKPNTFYRLRVGHVLKFGGSTRLYVLQVKLHDM